MLLGVLPAISSSLPSNDPHHIRVTIKIRKIQNFKSNNQLQENEMRGNISRIIDLFLV